MGAMKDFGMDISDIIGHDGDIDSETCDVAGRITFEKLEQNNIPKPWDSSNIRYRQYVMKVLMEYMSKPEFASLDDDKEPG